MPIIICFYKPTVLDSGRSLVELATVFVQSFARMNELLKGVSEIRSLNAKVLAQLINALIYTNPGCR
jgi:hypothetical protein